jgi:lipopolysaccharide/colanic/teichoic acid biosynthesis glycosyltransferase
MTCTPDAEFLESGEGAGDDPVKATMDLVLALLLTIVAIPVTLVTALVVKLTSRGPAFYSQTRTGRNGQPYRMYKVRTMVHNCESKTGPQWATRNDPRVTRVGSILRRTHLDELPQLWNVLRGEMSLVGPRPERPEFVVQLDKTIPCYRDRLAVRPGITGLAQIQLPPDTDLDSVRLKLAYDLYYAEHASLWLDLRIILTTGLNLVGIPTAFTLAVLRIPTGARVENAYEARSVESLMLPNVQPT